MSLILPFAAWGRGGARIRSDQPTRKGPQDGPADQPSKWGSWPESGRYINGERVRFSNIIQQRPRFPPIKVFFMGFEKY